VGDDARVYSHKPALPVGDADAVSAAAATTTTTTTTTP
jgi:hypothetical protein